MTQFIDRNKKIIIAFCFIFLFSFSFTPATSNAQTTILDTLVGTGKKCNYVDKGLYMPYSTISESFPIFGKLVNGGCVSVKTQVVDMFVTGFKVFLGLVSIFAVINISIAGIQYMVQEKDTAKLRGAKKRLTQSIVGLILAFSGVLILTTVNGRLSNVGFDLTTGRLGTLVQMGADNVANIKQIEGTCFTGECKPTTPGTGGSTGGTGGASGEGMFNDDFLKQKINESGITGLSPSDMATFFPDGQSTPENWLKLAKGIAKYESSFKANTLYAESFGDRPPAGTPGRIPESEYPNSNPGKLSIGLFALSWDDPEVKARGYTERDLQDPNKNLEVGMAVMKRVIEQNGCIACASMKDTYWSVLKNKQSEIQDYIRNN